jgi:integrase
MTAAEGRESPYPLAALRLLIFTGARCNEILSLRWSDIDFPRKQILLRDHKSRTTSRNKVKVIHLNDAALEILAGLASINGNPYVIAGEREGQHWIGLQKVWERIRKADCQNCLAKMAGAERMNDCSNCGNQCVVYFLYASSS